MFWKRRMTPEEAKEIVRAAEEQDERFRLITELARTIHAEHLQAIEQMAPGERAILREIRALADVIRFEGNMERTVRNMCFDEAAQIIKARDAAK